MRVEGPDGQWRTLDSRALHKWRPAAAAVAERTAEERLTDALGLVVATRPDGKAREVLGVAQQAMDLISNRRRVLTARAAELVAAFETRYGRAANGWERERLTQQATLLTRDRKSHDGETREQLLDRVDAQLRAEVVDGMAGVAAAALVDPAAPRGRVCRAADDGVQEPCLTAAEGSAAEPSAARRDVRRMPRRRAWPPR